jgi:hypothetical protein
MGVFPVDHAHMPFSSFQVGYIAIASVVVLGPLVALIYQLMCFHIALGMCALLQLFSSFSAVLIFCTDSWLRDDNV